MSKLSIRSRTDGADSAAEIRVEAGGIVAGQAGGRQSRHHVEVRDLFFSTPARLKFMKGERAESSAITDIVKRIAVAFPAVRFTLAGSDRTRLDYLPAGDGADGQLSGSPTWSARISPTTPLRSTRCAKA